MNYSGDRLYHNQLNEWRKDFEANGIEGLNKSAPGPKSKTTPDQKRIVFLEKEVFKLNKQGSFENRMGNDVY